MLRDRDPQQQARRVVCREELETAPLLLMMMTAADVLHRET
jgi:hypothetical protein